MQDDLEDVLAFEEGFFDDGRADVLAVLQLVELLEAARDLWFRESRKRERE